MTIDKECLGYARDCERLAGRTDDLELRDLLLQIARDWMAVAMREDKGPLATGTTPAVERVRFSPPDPRTKSHRPANRDLGS